MVYDLPLTEEKVKPHHTTTLHLICALAFIGTGAIILRYNYIIPMWGLAILIAGILLLAVTVVKNKWVISNKVNLTLRIAELMIALAIGVYSVTQQWKFPMGMFGVLSASILFSMYWERTSSGKLFVHIDKDGLKLPVTSRKRFLAWQEVENVVLRFGTLTIDCADNRLFQWNVSETGFDSDIFEAFCKAMVDENRNKRRNDDW
jgi:hypothetical protein